MQSIESIFTPAEFNTLTPQGLEGVTCVVFDILRATTSMVTALASGAQRIVPVATIADALELKRTLPSALLAGERDGLRITAAQTGSIEFDLGNSPREFTAARVEGREIIMTTTNGTRALRACMGASAVYVSSFLNMEATASHLATRAPEKVLLVCSGTFEQAAYEDILAAGCMVASVLKQHPRARICDSALTAKNIFEQNQTRLEAAMGEGRNGARLLSRSDLAADVAFCATVDALRIVTTMAKDGSVAAMRS